MIDIHLVSYRNIGPREDKLITLALQKGKYLIKSPIWSGKSFLFFDGILYWLYGHSYRDVLNKNSSSWYIKILFEIDNQFYLIIRNLGKSKTTKSLEFYIVHHDADEIWKIVWSFDDIINFDTDFVDLLDTTKLETLDLIRIPEIEEQIRWLLPPRQVFEHQNLFMQSSDNIFELQPKQRIDLLKQIFNLDFLESYKNTLSEDKNSIITQIKIYEKDNSHQDKYIQIRGSVKFIVQDIISNKIVSDPDISTLQEIISHPLSDQWWHLDDTLFWLWFESTISYINTTKETYTQLTQTKAIISKQIVDMQNQIISYDQEITNITQLLSNQPTVDVDDKVLSDLESKKTDITAKMWELDDDMYDNQIISLLAKQWESIIIWNMISRNQAISKLVDIWKDQKNTILGLELEKKNIEQEHGNIWQDISSLEQQLEIIKTNEFANYRRSLEDDIKTKEHEIEKIKSKIITHQELLVGIENSLSTQQSKFDKSMTFHCERIEANCPFIDKINDHVISNLKKDLDHINKQKQDTLDLIAKLESSIVPIQSEITSILNKISESNIWSYIFQSTDYNTIVSKIDLLKKQSISDSHKIALSSIDTKITIAQSVIENIKTLLTDMGWYNHITTTFQTRSDHKKHLEDIDNQIISYQKKLTQIQQQKLILAEKQNQLTSLEKEKQKSTTMIADYDKQIVDLTTQIGDIPMVQLQQTWSQIDELKRLISRLKDIHDDNKERELKIVWLKSDLEISAWLFDVFNKEFMLYVMQNYLPILTDFINTNLYKVVDYQIYIWVHPDGDALEILVKDALWDRDVKSLSWWQRAILRLCWILAITYIGNNKILFMDETINNIDPETIEKVADMLTDFIKQNDLKFYTITHSTQIQTMNIWDSVISVDR